MRAAGKVILLVAMAVPVLTACGGDDPASTNTTAPAGGAKVEVVQQASGDASVAIPDFEFAPAQANVRVGEVVAWKNEHSVQHTVTASGREFDSGRLATGASFAVRFLAAGTYRYGCIIHPTMQASVTVA